MKKLSLTLAVALSLTMLAGCRGQKQVEEKKDDEKVKIGIVQYMDHISLENAKKGFIDGLKEEGIDAEIEVQNENGDSTLTTTVPKKFAGDDYDLVYAIATPAAQGAKTALPNKKIIFSAVTDPVESGLVDAYDKIENITGITDAVPIKNQLETLLKLDSNIKTIGVIYSTFEINSLIQMEEVKKICKDMGLELEYVGINNINEIPQAIASIEGKIDALYALTDSTVASAAPIISKILNDEKIISFSAEEGQVTNGLLMSEGVDYYLHGKQAAKMAAKILKGEDIKNIHVEDNKENVKKVNKKTAEILGINLDSEVLKDAEVVGK